MTTAYIEVRPRDFQENDAGTFIPVAADAREEVSKDEDTVENKSPPHVMEANSIMGFITTHKVMLGIILAIVVLIIIVVIIYKFMNDTPASKMTDLTDEATTGELEAFLLTAKSAPPIKITQVATAAVVSAAVVPAAVVPAAVAPVVPVPVVVAPVEVAPSDTTPVISVSPDDFATVTVLPDIKEESINDDYYMTDPDG